MSVIELPAMAVVYAFTCPANGSYIGFRDEKLGRWRYFEIMGRGDALEPLNRALSANEERHIRIGRLERELEEGQFGIFARL